MDIELLIQELEKLRTNGVKRVFVWDATRGVILDLVEVQTDDAGDGIILAD